MDWTNINQLIDKYYEGETTLAEEQQIRSALKREDCPEQLKAEAILMQVYQVEAQKHSNQLNFKLGNEPQEPTKGKKLYSIAASFSGIAAAVLLAILFVKTPSMQCANNQPVLAVINNQPICDEQIAKQEAEKALQIISQQLNKGTSKLEYIKTINTVKK